jgi:hypothetical protein
LQHSRHKFQEQVALMDDKMKQDFAEYLTKSFITFMDLSRTIDGLESYYLRNKSQLDVIKGTDETLYADIIEAFKNKKAKILEKQK